MDAKNTGREANVMWADEVRQEEGGKLSIIGLYATNLDVVKGSTLKQIYAFVEVTSPVDRPFKSLKFVAMCADKEVLNLSLPEAAMETVNAQSKAEREQNGPPDEESRIAVRAAFPFYGITVSEPSRLTLSIFTEEGEMRNTAALYLRPKEG